MNPFWSGFIAGGLICSMLTIIVLGIIDIVQDRKRFRMIREALRKHG